MIQRDGRPWLGPHREGCATPTRCFCRLHANRAETARLLAQTQALRAASLETLARLIDRVSLVRLELSRGDLARPRRAVTEPSVGRRIMGPLIDYRMARKFGES